MTVFIIGLFVSWMVTAILVCCVIELFIRVKRLSAKIPDRIGKRYVRNA